jgi:hypothetical protein
MAFPHESCKLILSVSTEASAEIENNTCMLLL